MAVIQISTIQVRRGLQENLPQLASAELAWSIDKQRMFVGNGTLAEGSPQIGNTEILTGNSDLSQLFTLYTFRGEQSGYISQTGPSANTPVQRSVVEKLDDTVSLLDFVTDADIASGDYAIAIQRAINQIYPAIHFNTRATRRRLYIPAGDYPVSAVIIIPPYARIAGDGPESTKIIGTGAAAQAVFMLSDSLGQINSNLGLNGSVLPRHNEISNMTVEQSTDNPCVLLDSVRELHCNNVKFRGMHLTPATIGTGSAGVHIINTAGLSGSFTDGPTGNIIFRDCYFLQHRIGVLMEGEILNVAAVECTFETMYQGVVARATSGNSPQAIRIGNSRFHTIAQEAMVSEDESSMISAFNFIAQSVGYGNGTSVVSGIVNSAAIRFNTSNNYAVGTLIERTPIDAEAVPSIKFTNLNNPLAVQTLQSAFGSLVSEAGRTATILDNTASVIAVLSGPESAIVDYSIVRGTNTRFGTIMLANNGTTVVYQDDYSESALLGAIMSVAISGTTVDITCGIDAAAIDATVRYNVRSFI